MISIQIRHFLLIKRLIDLARPERRLAGTQQMLYLGRIEADERLSHRNY